MFFRLFSASRLHNITNFCFRTKINILPKNKELYCLLVTEISITIKACGQSYWAAACIALSRRQFSTYLMASVDRKEAQKNSEWTLICKLRES